MLTSPLNTNTHLRDVVLMSFVILLATLFILLLSLFLGSTGTSPIFDYLHRDLSWKIIMEIRLPRSLGAWTAGALLGLAGALAQGYFRNPLADPFLLGSASGASVGVAIGLIGIGASSLNSTWFSSLTLTFSAFIGASLGVLLTLVLARGVGNTFRLLLSGVIVGVILGSITQLIIFVRPQDMLTMQGFLLGSTGLVGWNECLIMGLVLIFCGLGAWCLSPILDALCLGEATASSLGVEWKKWRFFLIAIFALSTAAAVSNTGLIAFVGLAAPHIVRSLIRCSYRYLLFLASLVGGSVLLVADLLARTLISPQELPVGVLTSVCGGIYLMLIMNKNQKMEIF